MTPDKPADKKQSKINFSMKMPDWFIDDLSVEERKEFIDRLKNKDINFQQLSFDALKQKKFLVKKFKA